MQHIKLEADGVIRITYDDPATKDPMFGELGAISEWRHNASEPAALVYERIALLCRSAEVKLPSGSVYELREKIPTNYGRNRGIAWYFLPTMKGLPLTECGYPGKHDVLGGYRLIARRKTKQ